MSRIYTSDAHKAALAASGIYTWTSPEELMWLADRARFKRVLEIGTYMGASAKVMAQTAEFVMCVDSWTVDGTCHVATHHLKEELASEKVAFMKGDAGAMAAKLSLGEATFDMIWIDDGHTYEAVIRDCLIALLLRKDSESLICGHDYETSVKKAVDDCFGQENIKRGPGKIWYL